MIDLIPKEYYKAQEVELDKFGLIIIITVIVVAISAVGLNYLKLTVENNILEEKINFTQEQLHQVQQQTTEVLRLRNQAETLQTRLEQKEKVIGDRVNWALVLYELEEILPKTSWLNNYQLEEDRFKLSGYALKQEDFKGIINRFKKSKYFTDIYVELAAKTQLSKEGYQDREVLQYQVSGQVVIKGE